MTVTETLFFTRDGLTVVLAFQFDDLGGTANCKMSYHLDKPQSFQRMAEAIVIFRAFVNDIQDGNVPRVPNGWTVRHKI